MPRPYSMKKLAVILGKVLVCLALFALLVVIGTSVSPIYKFREPQPFSGPDIFNPYRNLDTAKCWKRALFHCHTRVKGPFPPNECELWPGETYEVLEKLGYDIVTFSNHNELTTHPFDTSLQVNVYEHGWSPFKFHKLVFGSSRVNYFDPLLPLLASQKQLELDYLGAGSDFIQINHPYRTIGTCKDHFQKLSGYEIMELDSGHGTQNEYWDWALSAGHYSFGLANDDLHHPTISKKTAVRCNFLCTEGATYKDIKETLLGGCYYAMRVPDYGNGDWAIKTEMNHHLPYIKDIGLRDDGTIYLLLSEVADSIRVNGQDHRVLALEKDTDRLEYQMAAEDSYARITAYFPGKEVIYTNPFARYDKALADSPFNNAQQKLNIPLTVLYNMLVLILFAAVLVLIKKTIKKK